MEFQIAEDLEAAMNSGYDLLATLADSTEVEGVVIFMKKSGGRAHIRVAATMSTRDVMAVLDKLLDSYGEGTLDIRYGDSP